MSDVSVKITGGNAQPKVIPQDIKIQFPAQVVGGGGSDAHAEDPDGNGNVELFGITATAVGGNVEINGDINCAESDGNVVITADSSEGQVIGNNDILVSVSGSDLVAEYAQDDVFVIIQPQIIREISGNIYDGDYSVTPGETAIVLQTSGKSMVNNVTVAPVPSNYGRIDWNGSFLTVS